VFPIHVHARTHARASTHTHKLKNGVVVKWGAYWAGAALYKVWKPRNLLYLFEWIFISKLFSASKSFHVLYDRWYCLKQLYCFHQYTLALHSNARTLHKLNITYVQPAPLIWAKLSPLTIFQIVTAYSDLGLEPYYITSCILNTLQLKCLSHCMILHVFLWFMCYDKILKKNTLNKMQRQPHWNNTLLTCFNNCKN
jgi:hypothetical protein